VAVLLGVGLSASSGKKAPKQPVGHDTPASHSNDDAAVVEQHLKDITSRMEAMEQKVQEQAAELKAAKEGHATELARSSKFEEHIKSSEEKSKAVEAAKATNRAFVFIKPHAVTHAVDNLVRETFAAKGIDVKLSGTLDASTIDEKKLIDTHYGAIAAKATGKPEELNVPDKGKQQFKQAFGTSWEDAVKQGKVLNSIDAMKKLNTDGDGLEAMWRKVPKSDLIKFGGGFYCARLKPDLYVLNGFYAQMRDKYTKPPAQILYYEVEFDPATLHWKTFREDVLGGTDPTKAKDGSLRRVIYEKWDSLGLKVKPDTGDNGLHASASPFEALAEVHNWRNVPLTADFYGKGLLAASGLDEATLKKWLGDAQVPVDGKPSSIFDTLEDRDAADCLEQLAKIAKGAQASPSSPPSSNSKL